MPMRWDNFKCHLWTHPPEAENPQGKPDSHYCISAHKVHRRCFIHEALGQAYAHPADHEAICYLNGNSVLIKAWLAGVDEREFKILDVGNGKVVFSVQWKKALHTDTAWIEPAKGLTSFDFDFSGNDHVHQTHVGHAVNTILV